MYEHVFTHFQGDLEDLNQTHPHKVRRESETTYIDEFAFNELIEIRPELYEQYLKGWSRSYYSGEKHLKEVLQYALPDVPKSRVNQQIWNKSVDEVRIRLRGLQVVRAFDILSEIDQVSFKQSSAAGYDYIGAKGILGGENHRRAIRRAKAIMYEVVEKGTEGLDHAIITMVPDVGYTRTQLTDVTEKTKIRNVWGRSFHYILLEGVVAHPLLTAFQHTDTFYSIGRDPTVRVPEILSSISADSNWLYAIDWKSFDATVSRFEINQAFDLIKEIIAFPNKETEAAFEISRQLFIHKKIAAPDGKIYWSHKGIPSGSYFTSVIGSIVNRLRIEYLWRTLTGRSPKHCFTQGDDSISGDDDFISPESFASVANQIGWYFNPAKTEYSRIPERVTFLGRSILGGQNIRDLKRCLRLLIYPEYPVESGRISAYRAKSIAEDTNHMSLLLNDIAKRLRRKYGIASLDEVPLYLRNYVVSNLIQ